MPSPVCCQNCLARADLLSGKRTRKRERESEMEMQCCTTRAVTSRAARNARHASADLREGKRREVSLNVLNFCSRRVESCEETMGSSEKIARRKWRLFAEDVAHAHLLDVRVYEKARIPGLHGIHNPRLAFFISNIIGPLW
jgi:hypothetical protein